MHGNTRFKHSGREILSMFMGVYAIVLTRLMGIMRVLVPTIGAGAFGASLLNLVRCLVVLHNFRHTCLSRQVGFLDQDEAE